MNIDEDQKFLRNLFQRAKKRKGKYQEDVLDEDLIVELKALNVVSDRDVEELPSHIQHKIRYKEYENSERSNQEEIVLNEINKKMMKERQNFFKKQSTTESKNKREKDSFSLAKNFNLKTLHRHSQPSLSRLEPSLTVKYNQQNSSSSLGLRHQTGSSKSTLRTPQNSASSNNLRKKTKSISSSKTSNTIHHSKRPSSAHPYRKSHKRPSSSLVSGSQPSVPSRAASFPFIQENKSNQEKDENNTFQRQKSMEELFGTAKNTVSSIKKKLGDVFPDDNGVSSTLESNLMNDDEKNEVNLHGNSNYSLSSLISSQHKRDENFKILAHEILNEIMEFDNTVASLYSKSSPRHNEHKLEEIGQYDLDLNSVEWTVQWQFFDILKDWIANQTLRLKKLFPQLSESNQEQIDRLTALQPKPKTSTKVQTDLKDLHTLNNGIKNLAAVKLQAFWRGFHARKVVKHVCSSSFFKAKNDRIYDIWFNIGLHSNPKSKEWICTFCGNFLEAKFKSEAAEEEYGIDHISVPEFMFKFLVNLYSSQTAVDLRVAKILATLEKYSNDSENGKLFQMMINFITETWNSSLFTLFRLGTKYIRRFDRFSSDSSLISWMCSRMLSRGETSAFFNYIYPSTAQTAHNNPETMMELIASSSLIEKNDESQFILTIHLLFFLCSNHSQK
eukprot:gb/GECH01006053.1/.p1 GENE.gb/GECH01006053.1/~~gb/GECH01006053.1/.p1  ORF type:complete len:671 (+),score=156.40 gb/GECH01006053.1/:1-2013(+)